VVELRWLVGTHPAPCISIYQPTHRHHPGTEQDPVRFRGLIRRVEGLLARRPADARERLVRPLARLDDPSFWEHQKDRLAAFRTPDELAVYQLSARVPEVAVVSDTFHTKPLVRFLNRNRRYYLLAISRSSVSLYHGDREGLSEVDLAGVPGDLQDAL